MIGEMMDYVTEIGVDVYRQTDAACKDADLIIHSFLHAAGAHTYAHERNIPDIHIQTFPMFTPTGDYPNVTMPDLKSSLLNRFTHILSERISWWGARLGFEQVRRRGRLPIRKLYWPFAKDPTRPPTPILCAWSPSVIAPSQDWPAHVTVTGWYFLDLGMDYSPSAELQTFLDSGRPPVCVSFGSMVNRDAEKIHRIVHEALLRTENRGIILSGWSGVRMPSSKEILYLNAVPHDWLLPRCKMIVHHGGAGTTSAGLRAGVPNIVVPFAVDQPFWGRRVHAIGAGPNPIPVRQLSIERLVSAILEAGSDAYYERARIIGQTIRSEAGVDLAVDFIESTSNDFHSQQL